MRAPYMDEASQRRGWNIGTRLGKLPFDAGWRLLYEPQQELGGRSCKQAADEGMFDEIEALLDSREKVRLTTLAENATTLD